MVLTGYEPKRYHKGADGDTPRPSPFWSEEVQRQFMEATQSSQVARPSDLARHEQSEEQRLKEEQAEYQQQLEPPYGGGAGDQATVGLDPETQRLVSDGASAEESMRGRSSAPAQNPLVARLDVQDSSPRRRSMGQRVRLVPKRWFQGRITVGCRNLITVRASWYQIMLRRR